MKLFLRIFRFDVFFDENPARIIHAPVFNRSLFELNSQWFFEMQWLIVVLNLLDYVYYPIPILYIALCTYVLAFIVYWTLFFQGGRYTHPKCPAKDYPNIKLIFSRFGTNLPCSVNLVVIFIFLSRNHDISSALGVFIQTPLSF